MGANKRFLVGTRMKALLKGCLPIAAILLSGRVIQAAVAAMQRMMLNLRESSLVEKNQVKKILHFWFQFLLVKIM